MSDKPKVYLEDKEIYTLMKTAIISVNAVELVELMKKSTDPDGKKKAKRIDDIEKNANGEGKITLQGKGTNDFQII